MRPAVFLGAACLGLAVACITAAPLWAHGIGSGLLCAGVVLLAANPLRP